MAAVKQSGRCSLDSANEAATESSMRGRTDRTKAFADAITCRHHAGSAEISGSASDGDVSARVTLHEESTREASALCYLNMRAVKGDVANKE